MSGPKYIITNRIDGSAVTLSAPDGGTATGTALANLYAGRPSKPWRSGSGLASVTTQRLIIDRGVSPATDDCIIIHNPRNWGDSTVNLESDTTSGFASPTNLGTIPFTIDGDDCYLEFTDNAERYVAIKWVYGADDVAPQIGELVLGQLTQLSRSFRWGHVFGKRARRLRHETMGGAVWMAKAGHGTRVFTLGWSGLSASQLKEIYDLWDGTAEEALPFSVIPYPGITDAGSSIGEWAARSAECHMVEVIDDFEATDNFTGDKHSGLVLAELGKGLTV